VADGVHAFVVRIEAPAAAETLAAAVTAAGFGLLEMTETATDLEGLFLDLTGRAAA
jgi:2-keto-3-deoxy-6-phosphogluconate aldolase